MHHKIAFVDLDGTVNSSNKYRAHLVPADTSKEENWAAWHAAHVSEEPNHAIIDTVKALREAGWFIIFLTMRSYRSADSSLRQLNEWIGPPYSLITKSEGDHRKPGRYKADEVSAQFIMSRHTGERVDVLVIDDSPEVCEAVRKMGHPKNARLNVLQITPFTGE